MTAFPIQMSPYYARPEQRPAVSISQPTTNSRPSFQISARRSYFPGSTNCRLRVSVHDALTNRIMFMFTMPMRPTPGRPGGDCEGSRQVLFPIVHPANRAIYLSFDDGGSFVARSNGLGKTVPFTLADLAHRSY